MAKFKRPRAGSYAAQLALPTDEARIHIGDYCVGPERHRERLHDEFPFILARVRARSAITPKLLSDAGRAATCRRTIVSTTGSTNEFEIGNYCRVPSLCRVCHYQIARKKAEKLDITQFEGMRLLHFIFTLPSPSTEAESIKYAKLASTQGMQAIRRAIDHWKRPSASSIYQLGPYVLGLHTKPRVGSPFHWSHLHFVILVDADCPFRKSATGETIRTYFEKAFDHATGELDVAPKVNIQNVGILGARELSDAERRKKHRGKTVSFAHATNLIAYSMRYTEEDDTPESLAERDKLFETIGLRTSYTRSRGGDGSKASLPNQFPPGPLGKKKTLLFPCDGSKHHAIDEADFEAVLKSQRAWATQHIRSQLQPPEHHTDQ